ncbi:alpha/beta hydrolase [Plantibacter flavus]|uniref:alpha/beta hydrolase family protein n=1 Tax=Plantibacter flavus TaxID=150123 RepID=UPI003F1578CA
MPSTPFALAGVLTCAAVGAATIVVARMIVRDRPPQYVTLRSGADADSVRLGLDTVTALPGQYALEFATGERVLLGEVLSIDDTAREVLRQVIRGSVPATATHARFTGTAVLPEDLAAPTGPIPRTASGSWRLGDPGSTTWAVHVHGRGASPMSTLRTVRTTERAGLPSLVASFGHPFEARRTGLASDDIDRVVAAIDDAVTLGAERVVLFGWSFGAAVSLAAARARPSVVIGAVLVAPMLHLERTVLAGAQSARVPRWLARLALHSLRFRPTARLAGAHGPLPIRELSDDRAPAIPVLAIHSPDDRTIAFRETEAAAERSAHVDLLRVDGAPHGLEWNRDPERFEHEVAGWVTRVAGMTSPSHG